MSCPDCFTGSIHEHGTPKGKEETVYGYRTYVAGGSNPQKSKSSILFLTDAFGLGLVNNLLLADRYATETGCRVLVPDIIPGGPMSVDVLRLGEVLGAPIGYNIFVLLRKLAALVQMFFKGIPFMLRGRPSIAHEEVVRYARAMRGDLPLGGKLGATGFCWGGYGATRLCTESVEEGSSEPLLDAQFNAHPSFVNSSMIINAIKAFKVPYSSAVASKDFMFDEKSALKTEAQLRTEVGSPEEANYQFVIYKGCKHGFAVRADPRNDKIEAQGMEDAAQQAVTWFNRFLN